MREREREREGGREGEGERIKGSEKERGLRGGRERNITPFIFTKTMKRQLIFKA